MKTIREIVYAVRGMLKATNQDDRLSNRQIAHHIYRIAQLLIRRDADTRRLYREEAFWQILCVELEPFSGICGDTDCPQFARSKDPLPELYQSVYGPLLTVLTLDWGKSYTYTHPEGLGRKPQFGRARYFSIVDGYLVISSSYLKKVEVRGAFLKPLLPGSCTSPLDYPLYIPSHLGVDLERLITTELRNITLPIPQDERADNTRGVQTGKA